MHYFTIYTHNPPQIRGASNAPQEWHKQPATKEWRIQPATREWRIQPIKVGGKSYRQLMKQVLRPIGEVIEHLEAQLQRRPGWIIPVIEIQPGPVFLVKGTIRCMFINAGAAGITAGGFVAVSRFDRGRCLHACRLLRSPFGLGLFDLRGRLVGILRLIVRILSIVVLRRCR